MNSAVGPIFNESFGKKKMFVGPVNSAQDPLTGIRDSLNSA